MTGDEFKPILAYAATACSAPPVTPQQAEIYFGLLRDLPANVVYAAVQQVVLDHPYPNLPPVGAIRKAAMALQSPAIPAAKAWELFREAVARFGSGKTTLWAGGTKTDIDRTQNGLESLPPKVARAARAFGWQTLCDTSPDDMGIAQTQFIKVYNSLTDDAEKNALMPPAVRALAENIAACFDSEPKALAAR